MYSRRIMASDQQQLAHISPLSTAAYAHANPNDPFYPQTTTFSCTSIGSPSHKCHARSRSQSLSALQSGTSPTPPISPAFLFFDPLHPTRIPLSLLLRFLSALSSLTPQRCAKSFKIIPRTPAALVHLRSPYIYLISVVLNAPSGEPGTHLGANG